MDREIFLRRKWTLRAHGRQMVFVKRPNETTAHVMMKAMLWGLYLPTYPDLAVEIELADRYQPDVVSFGDARRPRFWGEAGQVTGTKIRSLVKRYRETHFAIAKWAVRIAPAHSKRCFSKNSHIRSLAEMFSADLPRMADDGFFPGQV